MKFLHDAALAALTSELTDARLPGGGSGRPGRRALHGRIEAYTTKRAGTDKRVAHALGERYLMELRKDEVAEEEYRAAQRERLRRMFGDVDGSTAESSGVQGEEAEKEDAAPRAVLPLSALYGSSASPPESWGFHIGSSSSSRKDSGRSPKSVRIVSNDRSAGGNGNGGSSGGGGSSGSDEGGSNGGRRRVTGSKKSKPGGSRAGRRRRSQSIDVPSLSSKRLVSNDDDKNDDDGGAEGEVASGDGKAHGGSDGRRSGGGGRQRRARASSFDAAAVERAKRGTDKGGGSGSGRPLSEKERKSREKFEAKFGRVGRNKQGRSPPRRSDLARSPLGDFHEPPARRLMTDLVLTLNASFPDYDFGDYVRPRHFVRLGSPRHAVARVNERLGEYAATSAPSWRGCGSNSGAGLLPGGGAPSSAAVDADAYFAVGFLQKLWSSIDAVFGGGLKDCEVYSYAPGSDDQDGDDDPLGFLSQTLAGREEAGDGGGTPGANAGAGGVAGGGGGEGGDIVPLWTFNYFFVSRAMKRIVFFACVQTVNTEEEGASADDEEETTPYSYPASMAGRRRGAEDRPEEAEEMKVMDMVAPLPHFRAGHGGAPQASGDAASVGATSASGYYSVSSSNAASDVDFDMDGDGMAKDVPENDVTAAATARRVVSA